MGLKPQNVFHRFVTLTQTCGLQGLGRTTYINDHSSGAQTNPPRNQLRYFRSPICTTPKEKKEQQKSKIKKKPSWSAILFRAGFSKANIVLPQFKTFSVFKCAFSSTVHSLETSPSLERKVRFSSRRSPLSLGYKPKTVTSCP